MALNPTTQDKRGILERNFDDKFNSLFPAGDKPLFFGGDLSLSYTSESPVENGAEVTIRTDGTYNFGAGPTKYITMGFGGGWLYNNSDGTFLPEFITDNLSGSEWAYGFGNQQTDDTRRIGSEQSVKYLTAFVQGSPDGSADGSLGFINFDYGEPIPPGTPIFFSSWARASAEATDINGATQRKNYRLRPFRGFDGDNQNMLYSSVFAGIDSPNNMRYPATAGNSLTGGPVQTINTGWEREDLEVIPNDYAESNGTVRGRVINLTSGALSEAYPIDNSSPTKSGNGEIRVYAEDEQIPAFRWLMVQDFINQHDGEGRIDRTDFYWAVGSLARFELSDSADPQQGLRFVLPPIEWKSQNEVTVKYWEGLGASIALNYIHCFSDSGEHYATLSLGG